METVSQRLKRIREEANARNAQRAQRDNLKASDIASKVEPEPLKRPKTVREAQATPRSSYISSGRGVQVLWDKYKERKKNKKY